MKNYINPKEAICLIIYEKPLNVESICNKLYEKKRNSRVNILLRELRDMGWIKPIPLYDMRNHYYQSTPKFILDIIESHIELDPIDRKKIKRIIASDSFKTYIEKFTNDNHFKNYMFYSSLIIDTFTYFSTFSQVYGQYLCNRLKLKHSGLRKLLAKPTDAKNGFPREKIKKQMVSSFKSLVPQGLQEASDIDISIYEGLLHEFGETCHMTLLLKLSALKASEANKLYALAAMMNTLKLHDEQIEKNK